MVAASLIGWVFTSKDGTLVRNMSCTSDDEFERNSSPVITSTGTGESAAERLLIRVPVTIIFSTFSALSSASCANVGADIAAKNGSELAIIAEVIRLSFLPLEACVVFNVFLLQEPGFKWFLLL